MEVNMRPLSFAALPPPPQAVAPLHDLWNRSDWKSIDRYLPLPLSTDSQLLVGLLLSYCLMVALPLFLSAMYYYLWHRRRRHVALQLLLATSWALLPVFVCIAIIAHHFDQLIVTSLTVSIFALSLLLMTWRWHHSRLHPAALSLTRKKVLILGNGKLAWEMYQRALGQRGYRVSAIFLGSGRNNSYDWGDVHQLRSEHEIVDYINEQGIAEIWITVPLNQSGELQSFQYLLRNTLVDIRWIQDILSVQVLNKKATSVLDMPALDINSPDRQGLSLLKKNALDKTVALLAVIALLPVFLIISLLIKLASPGPVIYKQKRLGLDGKVFSIYKFRTMYVETDEAPFQQTTKNDPRVHKLGSFLRRNSLDELPQFFNVLLGDMSVVGPRPHALPHNEMFKDILDVYMVRHRVKPGITGWAQINGQRGEADTAEKMQNRIQLDLCYIQNWSIGLDVRIIVLTAIRGWKGKNAY
jgi:putative colanic acid biosynthesis UDP-glucose lipid carrier transferase